MHRGVFFDAGEAEIETAQAECQPLVIDPELMQDGGLQVVDVNGTLDDVEAEFIGLSDLNAAANSAASHPGGEGL